MAILSTAILSSDAAVASQYNNLRTDLLAHSHDGVDTVAIALSNNRFLTGQLAAGTVKNLIGIDASNVLQLGATGMTVNVPVAVALAAGLTLTGTLALATTASKVVPGATSLSLRNNADSADNLLLTDAGAATIRAGLTITAGGLVVTAGGLTVTAGGLTVTAGGLTITAGSLTMAAAASKLVPGATSFSHRNNADSADNLLISDAGLVTVRAGVVVTAGGLTVTAGGLTVTAGGLTITAGGLTVTAGATKLAGSYTTPVTSTPSAAATATLDLALGNIQHVTMPAGNVTIALSNAQVGQVFLVRILQDSVGSRTVTWFTTIKWAGGVAPTLTTTALKADVLGFECTGSGAYDGHVVGQNI